MEDVIIIGGSFAGLSAAMALGRSFRSVLIIDGGEPCNRQTPHAHNFITQDGVQPATISAKAKDQVLKYPTVKFITGKAVKAIKTEKGFEVITEAGEKFESHKLILATGIKDLLPDIPGMKESWGVSLLHCPYCHGYEVRNKAMAIIANGEMAFHLVKMIRHWSDSLVILTNGKSTLTEEQTNRIQSHHIKIIEKELQEIKHSGGMMHAIVFKDGSDLIMQAAFTKVPFEHTPDLYRQLGCELTEQGLIKVDQFQKTTVPNVFAAGDNSSMMRSLPVSIASGSMAGAVLNNEWLNETF